MSKCPICDSQLMKLNTMPKGGDYNSYNCPLCGEFSLTGSLVATLPHLREKHKNASTKLSHALRTMQKPNTNVQLNPYTADEIIKKSLPNPIEQADLFIRGLAG